MLRELIMKTAESKGITYKHIAQITGVSPATLSNFLHGKSEMNFYSSLKIVRHMFATEEKEIMTNYIEKLDKPENLRLSMEYASLQDMLDLLHTLIVSQSKSLNAINREWAKVYELEYKWKKGYINPRELIERNRNLRVKTDEMMFMRLWFEFYYHNYTNEYGLISFVSDSMELLLNNLNDPFLYKCFSTRFHITIASKFLYLDQLEKARYHDQLVIDNEISLEKSARMHHLLGLSYLFEDCDKSLKHLLKAKEFFVNIGFESEFTNIDKSIFFVNNYWGRKIIMNAEHSDPGYLQEVAHQAIRNGQLDTALYILKKIDIDLLSLREKAFQYYYLGLCENNIPHFYKSITLFNKSGNKLFAKLPYLELLRAGEKKDAVAAAYGELPD